MKKANLFISLIFCAMIFVSCGTNPKAVNSQDLAGQYKVDFTPMFEVAELNDVDSTALKFAKMITSNIDGKITFYENGQGVLDIDGFVYNLVKLFSDEELFSVEEFSYKIENDSLVHFSGQENYLIIRKIADSYDYLLLIDPEDKLRLGLKKIQDFE